MIHMDQAITNLTDREETAFTTVSQKKEIRSNKIIFG